MTTWHWIRHGPTHERTFVGWRDVAADLSDKDQIARLRAHLPDNAVVVASDLKRAQSTANALSGPNHVRLANDPHLRELHFGYWDGLPFEAVSARDPELSRKYWEAPGAVRAPGGESWDDASARVATAVRRISAQHSGSDIIAVAHFGVILTQLQRALNIPAYDTLAHPIDNLSVTRIDWLENGSAEVPHINLLL